MPTFALSFSFSFEWGTGNGMHKRDPERSALVVVDMQNVFCAPGQVVDVPEARGQPSSSHSKVAVCEPSGLLWM